MTEIIEINNELLVLKIEHNDGLNYIGMMNILLKHLRIARSILLHSAFIAWSVIFNNWNHRDTKLI